MIREKALKVALVIVGLLLVVLIYPLRTLRGEEALQMMLSVYVALGFFLLLASRNPATHRSLIAFAGWSSVAHATVMAAQSLGDTGERMHLLVGTTLFFVIGVVLMALTPAKAQAAAAA